MKTLLSIFVLALTLLLPQVASAASLYFDPSALTFGPGDLFSLRVRVDNEGQCLNAFAISLVYPKEVVKAVDISMGDSIISLLVGEPKISIENGTVEFSGGIPGGYCGRIQGDPGLTNVLGEIVFQAVEGVSQYKKGDGFKIGFNVESSALLNDGRGTPAKLSLKEAHLTLGNPGSAPVSTWLATLKNDATKPEEFSIELSREKSLFGGKYFVAFSTTDKQSGIDHLEVQEVDIDREGFSRNSSTPVVWKNVTSPYILEDQTLNSMIRVKALDKAGNERIAVYIPPEELRQASSLFNRLKFLFLSVFIIVAILISLSIRRRRINVTSSHLL